MRITLEKKWTEHLLSLPESGMGHQKVDIRFVDNRVALDVPVFNAEIIELPADLANTPIRELTLREGRP